MSAQTIDPIGLSAYDRRRDYAFYFDAEAADISAVDAVPTRTTPAGAAAICRGVNAQIAGLIKCDLAAGATGVTLAVAAGSNPLAVTKIYKTGTDVGLVGKLAFLF